MSTLAVVALTLLTTFIVVLVALFVYVGFDLRRQGNRSAAWFTWSVAGLVTVLMCLLLTSR